MTVRWAILAMGLTVASSTGFAATPPGRILVVSVGNEDVSDQLAAWVRDLTGERVVSASDVRELEPFDVPRPLAECRRAACFASWAVAAGCAHAVAVEVKLLAGKWRITARLVDSDSGALIKKTTQVVDGDRETVHRGVAAVLGRLLDKPVPTEATPPPNAETGSDAGPSPTGAPGESADPSRLPVVRPLLPTGSGGPEAATGESEDIGVATVEAAVTSDFVAPPRGTYARRIRISAESAAAIGSLGISVPSTPPTDRLQRLPPSSIARPCHRGATWACDELGRRVAVNDSDTARRTLTRACDRGSAAGCETLIAINEQLPFGRGARITGGILLAVGGAITTLGALTGWADSGVIDLAAAGVVLGGIVGSTGALVYLIGVSRGAHTTWRNTHPLRSVPTPGVGVRMSF